MDEIRVALEDENLTTTTANYSWTGGITICMSPNKIPRKMVEEYISQGKRNVGQPRLKFAQSEV